MTTKNSIGIVLRLGWCAAVLGLASCATPSGQEFGSPEEAMSAVAEVAGSGDEARIRRVFGEEALEVLHSGDPVADRDHGLKVREKILQKVSFEDAGDGERIAMVGAEAWPFPIPLVRSGTGWRFDLDAGAEEVWNRRIGRNEISTIGTLHAYVDAQREYASAGRDGRPAAFARKVVSDAGRHDGLYWPAAAGEPESPFGPLMAEATDEGYRRSEDGPIPYHGYFYRILEAQGPGAAGGAKSYVDAQGLMTGGFAAVAWPAKHGNSGVMTFVVDHLGIVFQKDLGSGTASAAKAMKAFDPDETWAPARL